jgi:hypothetical protein
VGEAAARHLVGDQPNYVALLLAGGADPALEFQDFYGGYITPLFLCASFHGNVRVARLLVGAGANIEGESSEWVRFIGPRTCQETRGGSALTEAVMYGRVELVQYLLEHGADVAAENPCGDYPPPLPLLFHAIRSTHVLYNVLPYTFLTFQIYRLLLSSFSFG